MVKRLVRARHLFGYRVVVLRLVWCLSGDFGVFYGTCRPAEFSQPSARQEASGGIDEAFPRRCHDRSQQSPHARPDTKPDMEAATSGKIVSAVMIDIDYFKKVNDIHGHLDGNNCIQTVSSVANDSVGPCGAVFRYGGEQAARLASRIREAVQQLATPPPGSPYHVVTISAGIATAAVSEVSLPQLLERADDVLYQTKRSGRNTLRKWNSSPIKEEN